MESISAPVEALAEKAAWFARAREIRLFHVATRVDLRESVLKHVLAQEFHADNRSPYYRQDKAYQAMDAGWVVRAERLRLAHERRREAMARAGVELPALPLAPREVSPLALFAAQVGQVLQARCAPMEGLVVVLAPTRVDTLTAFEADVRQLVQTPRLKAVRWVIVQLEGMGLPALLEELGPVGMRAECLVDEADMDVFGLPAKSFKKAALKEVEEFIASPQGRQEVLEQARKGLTHFSNNANLVSRIQAVIDCLT